MSEQTAKSSLGIVPSVHSRLLLVMVFCRICSPNLREKAPSQKKTPPCSPQQGWTPATEHGQASRAARPASPLVEGLDVQQPAGESQPVW